ncbi:MAG TPA: hypothetical protein VG826_34730 [Pirellulales bacterium]|nr:hypothetical protein [Pirellulales bacterium]
MCASPVVFCERTGNWAAAWRRLQARREQVRLTGSRPTPSQAALSGSRVRASPRLIETRSAAECREVLAANRGSFVVVELEPVRAEQALDLLFDIGEGFREATSVVVASRQMLGHEWLARELGAQAFVVSPLEIEQLCDLAQRHAGRSIGRASAETGDVRERVWMNLPWGGT